MKKSLLKLLICPSCGAALKIEQPKEEKGEIVSGELTCRNNHRFSVIEGVPRLILKGNVAASQTETQSSFSEKWARVPDYGYEKNSMEYLLKWDLERYGWTSLKELKDCLAGKNRILDAGMGSGRFTYIFANNTRGQVYGVDISNSVVPAYKHLSVLPNAHAIQTDYTQMPFPRGFFDFILAHGTLHHTPDTENSFKYLTEFLAPGGQIAIYVYKIKGPIREFCDDFIRGRTTKMSAEECYKFSETITKLGKSLADMKVEIDIPEDIPLLGIKAGKQDLQRFIYWNVFKCYWNDVFDYENNVMVNFDWYHPLDAHRHTPEEVRGWFNDVGFEIVNFETNESGISIRGAKPKK